MCVYVSLFVLFGRDWCAKTSTLMHKTLVLRFMEVQILLLTPVCPHFAEHFWARLGHAGGFWSPTWSLSMPAKQ